MSLNPPSKGWYSRGYLPHFDRSGLIQSITFRLDDALPSGVLDRWQIELQHLDEASRHVERKRRIETYLDAGHGSCWLRLPVIAEIVENALLHFDAQRYSLIAWCIMPNHLHVMIECFQNWDLSRIVHSWKSYTSHEINVHLNRHGIVWQRDYHDRFIRDDDHFRRVLSYIEENPVKAGLATKAEDWPWSSRGAHERHPVGDLLKERRLNSLNIPHAS